MREIKEGSFDIHSCNRLKYKDQVRKNIKNDSLINTYVLNYKKVEMHHIQDFFTKQISVTRSEERSMKSVFDFIAKDKPKLIYLGRMILSE